MIILKQNSYIHTIYHISDIHIRRYDKHAEYEIVFSNLYKYLNSINNDKSTSLIVITGDLLHAKDNLTPDCVIKCYKFLKMLADIMPVILIAGNHDMVESNKTIKDSIGAILNERSIDNLYYLQHSGVYKYGNIIFGASSLLDNQFIKAADIYHHSDNILIGLYHGPVGACSTAVGVVLHGDKQIDDFIGYDFVLLGDIHKFQYMNNQNFNNTMAYASSLISQNFAEIDEYHGVLVWNLIDKTSHYQIIDNPYRYMRIDIVGGNVLYNDKQIDYNIHDFPSHAKIRLNIIETHKDTCEKIKKTIRKRFPHILFQEIVQKNNSNTIENINKDFNYNDMLQTYIEILNKEEYDEALQIFMKDLSGLNITFERQLCQWEFLDLEFSNMFVYGPNNKIDFTKLPMNDIVGLFAPNSYGKSSFIDIILFSLYDNFSRNVYNKHRTIPSYIVNNNCSWFETKIRFKLGSDIYCIHKKGVLKGKSKSKTGKAITFEIYSFTKTNDNNIIDITRKDRFETLEEISKVIGSYNDFCLTSLFLQNKEQTFYDMSSTDRKNFLYNMFNLDKFENMFDTYKNIEKTSKALKDDFESKILNTDIDTILDNIDNDKQIIRKYNTKINKYNEIKNILNKKKSKLILLLNNNFDVDYDEKLMIEDIDRLKQNLDICNFIINNYTMYIGTEYNKHSINNINHLYESIICIDINNDINNIDIDFNKINENNSFLLNEESIINNYYIYKEQLNRKELLEYKLKVINDLIDLNEINEHCNMCMKRKPLLDDYNKQKIELIKSIDNININNKDDYDKLIIIKKQQEILINKYNNYKKKICKNIIDFNNNKFVVEYNWLDTIKEYREYLLKNIKYLTNNENIELIKKYDNKLNILEDKINNINHIIHERTYSLGINETKFSEWNNLKNDLKKVMRDYNIYSCLKKACHINGIPSKIISLQLENIDTMLNKIINGFIKKTVKISLDGNNIIVNILDDNNNIINILGGMEMFIINIGFKISLSSLSLLPKNKLLIIDEGVSVLDKQHIEQFDKIILFLNQHYENVILISHIDSLKDFISNYIHINKINNLSCTNY
uniref:Calcineurin-like phosphoesterase domain-containing protein n=1 Tax=viral metagenome TaxID=1070528 RepID=A0A6C0HW48_9ZZZZ